MAPSIGRFAIGRTMLDTGFFIECFTLTKEGDPFELDTIDTVAPQTPCIVSVSTRHRKPLPENITVMATFWSHAKCLIKDGCDLSIQMF